MKNTKVKATAEVCENNYYIAIYNRKGQEVNIGLCPTWYGVTEDFMLGFSKGLFIGFGRTAEVRAYELDGDGNRGRLLYQLSGK